MINEVALDIDQNLYWFFKKKSQVGQDDTPHYSPSPLRPGTKRKPQKLRLFQIQLTSCLKLLKLFSKNNI